MVRRYGDPVEVKARSGHGGVGPGDAGEGPPDSFLWRGRLYVVRSVLGHWRERRAWWTESAARAVHGELDVVGESEAVGAADDGDAGSGAGGLGVEREVWRVEASAGRRAGTGIYDLCRGPVSSWSLQRVAD
jgi:hypothetical protein